MRKVRVVLDYDEWFREFPTHTRDKQEPGSFLIPGELWQDYIRTRERLVEIIDAISAGQPNHDQA